MFPAKIAPRLAPCVLCFALLGALAGCKPAATTAPPPAIPTPPSSPGSPMSSTLGPAPHGPGTAELNTFFRANLPPVIHLVEVKNDPPVPLPNSAPGSNAWLLSVRLTLAPAEDELAEASDPQAQAFHAAVAELGYLAAWSQAYAQSPYARLYPGFTVPPPDPAAPRLLRLVHAKDRPYPPLYGKMAAEWQVDHWQFSAIDMPLPADEGGQFRAAFTGPVFIQGAADTAQFLAATQAAVAQARPEKEAIERRYQEDLAQATRPGTVYQGQVSRGKATLAAEVRFTAGPPGSDPDLISLELRLPASGYVYACSARRAKTIPNLPVMAAHPDGEEAAPSTAPSSAPGDLTVNYERVTEPRFNPANGLANELRYDLTGMAIPRDVPWSVIPGHQLRGKVTSLQSNPYVLAAQPSP